MPPELFEGEGIEVGGGRINFSIYQRVSLEKKRTSRVVMPGCRFIAIHIFVLTILAQTLSPNLLDDLNVIPECFYKTTNWPSPGSDGKPTCRICFGQVKIAVHPLVPFVSFERKISSPTL